jgi:Tol biopolymer transport system component
VIQSGEPEQARFTWFDRSGEERGVFGEPSEIALARLSPQGDRVVYSSPDPQTGNRDLWYIEIGRGTTSRLTNHVANDFHAVWSPDGRQLVFGSDRDGGSEPMPYLKTSMDPGSSESLHVPRQALTQSNDRVAPAPGFSGLVPRDWSADGRWMVYESASDLLVGPAAADAEPFRFLATPAQETLPRFSPNTRWIAYSSNENGRLEVYVRPFSGVPAASTGKVQVSHNGGESAIWGPTGREIFYITRDGSVFAVDTRNLGQTAVLPTPVRLFRTCVPIVNPARTFETSDGQRFLLTCPVEPPGRFTVLMNWPVP